MSRFNPFGKPAKRQFTAKTRGPKGLKTVTIQVPLDIDLESSGPPYTPNQLGNPAPLVPLPSGSVTADPFALAEHDSSPAVSKHHKKRIQAADKWSSLRNGLVNCLVMEAYPATFTCFICKKTPPEYRIYRCTDCGPMAYFCKDCCKAQHQCSLHSIEVWSHEDQHFQCYWLPTIWKRFDHHDCQTQYEEVIVVIDDRGHQRPQKMEFCLCEARALTLLTYGLWPASPDIPTLAFTIELMLTLRAMVLEGQLSLTAFCHGMQRYRVFMKKAEWVTDIANVLRWDVLLNFMEVYHDTKFMQYAGSIHSPLQCMACPKDNDKRGKIVAMDGNFRLVHRKAAGGPPLQVRHSKGFFLPQSEVDDFVAARSATRKPHTKTCSNFQADSVLRTKNKTDKLDITGVFGSVCNHDFPQKFFDMRFGERMAYPVLLMATIQNVDIMLYDIGCQLESHLKKNAVPYDCKIGVGLFHIYAHQRSCQVKYSPRTLDGAGLCDGEGTERVWSYLGRFSSISKEMTLENRADLLNEALLHYGNRITLKIGTILCQRLEKAYMLKDSTQEQLQNLMAQHPGTTYTTFNDWCESERTAKPKKVAQALDWKMDYALTLFDFYEELKNVQSQELVANEDIDVSSEDLDRIESHLAKRERKQKMARWASDSPDFTQNLEMACDTKRQERLEEVREHAVEYTSMSQLRRKYSKGGTLANRISGQTYKTSKKLTDAIEKYNSLPCRGSTAHPHRIERTDVLPVDSAPIWVTIEDDDDDAQRPRIALTEKRKCIDAYRLNQRAKEEIKRSLADMTTVMENIESRLLLMQELLEENSGIQEPSRLDLAIRAELRKHQSASKTEFDSISNLFSKTSRPHAMNMVAFIQIIEENLEKRVLPEEQEGLSAEDIGNVLLGVERVEQDFDTYPEDLNFYNHCER